MKSYQELGKEELLALKEKLNAEYEEAKKKGLSLDMSRGKPAVSQLAMGMDIMNALTIESDMKSENGLDVRNYGVLEYS